jgi:predicted O-methyltransferase YrrM
MSLAVQEHSFTQDWFSQHISLWEKLFADFFPDGIDRCLEIGSFEGRSTCWILENALSDDGTISCVDTWEGSPEISREAALQSWPRFVHNVGLSKGPDQKVIYLREKSSLALANLIVDKQTESFDFIYVDGSHTASDTLTDAVNAFTLLKEGGLMVFDDYMWELQCDILVRPKMAIDAFTTIFHRQLITVACGIQYVIRKQKHP